MCRISSKLIRPLIEFSGSHGSIDPIPELSYSNVNAWNTKYIKTKGKIDRVIILSVWTIYF